MGTHPIFESNFDCLTVDKLGSFWSKLDIMSIVEFKSSAEFDEASKNKPVVVHFWATWADQCAQMDEVLKALLEMHQGALVFGRCEAEEVSDLATRFNISAVPTVLLVKDGKEVTRINGVDPVKLSEQVEKLASGADGVEHSGEVAETLNEKLHRLIHQDRIVMFMKGMPSAPQCRFSKQLMELLGEVDPGLDFSHFNILEDQEVREGIKTYSNWPSFPQLYIEGDLVGGLDVMRELNDAGELLDMFNDADKMKTKLKFLIKKSKIQLFMKGNPSEPRCKFSRETIALLQEHGVDFGHFDIFSDEEVRSELKTFSNWPTYPQLYKNGELIGGLDVMKEMAENGELAELMNE